MQINQLESLWFKKEAVRVNNIWESVLTVSLNWELFDLIENKNTWILQKSFTQFDHFNAKAVSRRIDFSIQNNFN